MAPRLCSETQFSTFSLESQNMFVKDKSTYSAYHINGMDSILICFDYGELLDHASFFMAGIFLPSYTQEWRI